VLVVDDSPVFLEVAASLVSAAPSLRLIGVAPSGADAIEVLPKLRPDFVLVDFNMPGIDGAETAAVIGKECPEAVVVIISAEPAGLEFAARASGAVAVLDKRGLGPGVLEALWAKHRPER